MRTSSQDLSLDRQTSLIRNSGVGVGAESRRKTVDFAISFYMDLLPMPSYSW